MKLQQYQENGSCKSSTTPGEWRTNRKPFLVMVRPSHVYKKKASLHLKKTITDGSYHDIIHFALQAGI